MQGYRNPFLPFIALLASACGAGHDEPSLDHYGAEISESVDAIQTSVSSHHVEARGETDLEQIRAIERRHMDELGTRMFAMQDAQDSVALCGEHRSMAGRIAAVEQLHEARGDMADTMLDVAAEMKRHQQAMQDCPDVASAHAEERQHEAKMDQVLGRLRTHDEHLADAMEAMHEHGMSMMCPMSSHMHRSH